MNTTELLIIRACKSLNPEERLNSVYKRRYGDYDNKNFNISHILENICDKYDLISRSDLISDLNPYNRWKFIRDGEVDDYWLLVRRVLTSRVRLAPVDKFEGFIPPGRFKKKSDD